MGERGAANVQLKYRVRKGEARITIRYAYRNFYESEGNANPIDATGLTDKEIEEKITTLVKQTL